MAAAYTHAWRSGWSILLLLTGIGSTAAAQDADPGASSRTIPRLGGPIELDGEIREAAWMAVPAFEPVMFTPVFEGTSTQRTEIRVAHDGEHLWVAARLGVTDPQHIRGNSLQRDRLGTDDVFRIILDTFNDNENGVGFATTPTGVRADFSVSADGLTNYDWNTVWDVATSRGDSNWTVEMRIPFASLRFQSIAGTAHMGLLVMRSSAVLNETVLFPAVSPRFSSATSRVSQAQDIRLEGVTPSADVRVTPYVLGGGTRSARRLPENAGFSHQRDAIREAGVDLKYGLTSNLTLDVTVNTDFAQAEVDDQQVNLSRFGLFFPEKRQFFLERSGVFDFPVGGFGDASRVFHSRQIGLDMQGNPIRILGGGRLVGRVGGWDVAALNMQTQGNDLLPSENFGVLRIRRRVINSGSTAGGILTSRMNADGGRNHVYGLDGQFRLRSNDYLTMQWAQSFDDERPASGFDAAMARMVVERRSAQGFVYRLGAKTSGRDFDPEMGFAPRSDFTHFEGNLRYGWYPGARTVFQNIQPSLLATAFRRRADGVVESSSVTQFINYALKSGISGFVNVNRSTEVLPRDLQLAPGVVVPAGEHAMTSGTFFVSTPQGRPLRTSLAVDGGGFYDGERVGVTLSPSLTVSRHLELSGSYQANRIRFPQRGQVLNADIARLRVQFALNTRFSASGFVQYNRAADAVVSNVRLHLHLREGRDIFVVYNEQLNTDRTGVIPMPPLSQERALLVKMVYGFTP
jgi:hypothetical protein